MTTAAEYMAAGISRSYRNRGNVLAQDNTEGLARLSRQFRKYYSAAAGQNASVFGQIANLTYVPAPPSWVVPADCDTIHWIEQRGVPVYAVTYDDRREAEPSEACIYRLANRLYPVGNTTDPGQQALVVLYTPVPPDFTAVGDTAPAAWNSNFDSMVIVDFALFLAKKDGRPEDVQALMDEANEEVGLYGAWLARNTVPLLKRFGMPVQVPATNTTSIRVP